MKKKIILSLAVFLILNVFTAFAIDYPNSEPFFTDVINLKQKARSGR